VAEQAVRLPPEAFFLEMKKTNKQKTETISFQVTLGEANRIHRAALFSDNSIQDYLFGAVFTAVGDDEDYMDSENLEEMYSTKEPVRAVEFSVGRLSPNWRHRENLPAAPDWRNI
jgi:hypothetical protein